MDKVKKLLIVSGGANDVSFVNAARELGAYVVCCDAHTDWSRSPAKMIADEGWNINYADTQAVAEKCRECGIDGVIAGYSEPRVLAACRIANAIGTPFYATEEQINLTRDKNLFKQACQKHGVPVPRDYEITLPLSAEARAEIEYPVIVKPSDSAGRKGISVCLKADELDAALELALSQSLNGKVVVEEYIKGTELSAVYTLSNGKISLSCLNDKYLSEDQGGTSCLCDLVMTPSCYYDLYMKTVDGGIKAMLKDIGATNGVANIQMIVGKNGIRVFEMGYRVNGNDDFKVIRHNNGLDFMKMLVNHSLTGDMGDDLERDNPQFGELNCSLVMHLHSGTIQTIDQGELKVGNGINDIAFLKRPGNVVVEDGTNLGKAVLVKMSAKTLPEIIDMIHYIQKNISIVDTQGKNMVLKPFNTDRLLNAGY